MDHGRSGGRGRDESYYVYFIREAVRGLRVAGRLGPLPRRHWTHFRLWKERVHIMNDINEYIEHGPTDRPTKVALQLLVAIIGWPCSPTDLASALRLRVCVVGG